MRDILNYNEKNEQITIATDIGKRRKCQFIEDLKEGDVVNDLFAVKIKDPPRPYKKGIWFGMKVADKTGEIYVKYWGSENKERVKKLYDSFRIGDVVQLRLGNVEIYEDRAQISINESIGSIRRCAPNEYEVADFIPSLEEKMIKEFVDQIKNYIREVKNNQLKDLLNSFFDDKEFVRDFSHAPSAITHHHNYIGGNIEHTIGVIRLCKNICEMYSGINTDLVLAGAILHDIGKVKEYDTKAAIEKTDEGSFIGHIVLGERWIREKIRELRENEKEFSKDLENKLCHIILSHHGKYEYGSPRIPKTAEAMVVHQADMMDSQVKNFIQNIEKGRMISEDDWFFVWDADIGMKREMYLGEE